MMLAASEQTDENDLVRRVQEAAKSKALDLSGLRLASSLPPQIASLKFLRSLNLYKNFLETIPEEVLRFDMLEDLNLYRNRFARIPRSITKLNNLRVLNVGSNGLEVLAAPLFELKTLEELDLSNNQIKAIPPAIAQLSNLRDLKLNRNRIKSLPGEIGDLKLIRKLDISFNQIVNLPSNFGKLTALAVFSTLPRPLAPFRSNILHNDVSENPLRSPPMAIVKRGRQAIVQFLQQDSTDPAKSRADGAGLKGSIVGLTANFTIFSCNLQGRDRLAGGENFVVRITRDGVEPGSEQIAAVKHNGSSNQPESSDTDGASSPSTATASQMPNAVKSDTDDEPISSEPANTEATVEIPSAGPKPVVVDDAKRSKSKSSKKGHRGKKSNRKRGASPEVERRAPQVVEEDDPAESLESSDEQQRAKVALAVQENKNEFLAAITDNYNGTYSVTYTPMFEGSYQMSITLQGIHIEGSPFNIVVDPDLRDKAKTLEIQLEDEQRKLAEENERAQREAEARVVLEDELQTLRSDLEKAKLELLQAHSSLSAKDEKIEALEKENAELKEQIEILKKDHGKKHSHKKEHSASDDTAATTESAEPPAPVATLSRSKSGKTAKKKRQNSDEVDSSASNTTPRAEVPSPSVAAAPAPVQDTAAKKKARLSVSGALAPSVVISAPEEAVGNSTKSPRNSERRERRRSKGPADAAAIQSALQQQAQEESNDKKMSRSNSAPLNSRVEKHAAASNGSSSAATTNDSENGGQGDIETRSISYKFSLAFWKLFDKKEPKEPKEPKSKENSGPKSARATSASSKHHHKEDEGHHSEEDEPAKEKKSKQKGK